MKYPVVCMESDTSIQKAIQLIERSAFDRAFVLDEKGLYRGCVSIADLRRLLISGAHSEEPIDAYPLKHGYRLTEESLHDRKLAERMMSDMELYRLRFLPIVGRDGRVLEVLSVEDLDKLHGFSRNGACPNESTRRVLVVGGAGYLGSVLTGKLLRRGFRVRRSSRAPDRRRGTRAGTGGR